MKKRLALVLSLICLICSLCLCACDEVVEPEVEAVPSVEELEKEKQDAENKRNQSIADGSIADEVIEIYSAEGLMSIPDSSSRKYVLSADIDMTGQIWTPLDFSGSFDGAGHSINNLTVVGYSQGSEYVYDGNMKKYETKFCGMFGILNNAEVKNLSLKDMEFLCESQEENLFAGSIAGFMSDSLIDNVTVSGYGHLETFSKCFGIGGIAGYGKGEISNTSADMCLVCIDQNAEEKDEQFMGGAYAAGAIDLNGNTIAIDGYDSDHGYVHNGGLVGMYIHYYDGCPKGSICNNSVKGKIKFFEDNKDRRAYCEAYVGEMMSWDLAMNGNSNSFVRDEVFEYNKNLLP